MKQYVRRLVALALAMSGATMLSGTALGKTVDFKVGDQKKRDAVAFTSDAPLELIVGHTNNIRGDISVDDSLDLGKQPLKAQFDVDLRTIDTGIPLRNQHMRDNFLETAKYPNATFKLTSVESPVVLKPGEKQRISAVGEFTVHGKTVKKTVPVEVTYFKPCAATKEKMPNCDLIQISAEFPVAFKDHGIKRPEIVFQKLSDTVIVKVGATAFKPASHI